MATPAPPVLVPSAITTWGKISESLTNHVFSMLVPEGLRTFSQLSFLNKGRIIMFMLQVLEKSKLPKEGEQEARTLEWLVQQASALYERAGSRLGTGSNLMSCINETGDIDWTAKLGCYVLHLARDGTVIITTTKDQSMRQAPCQLTAANFHQWQITGNWNENSAILTNTIRSFSLKQWAAKAAVMPNQELLTWPTTPERTIQSSSSSPLSTERQTRAAAAAAAAVAAAKRQRTS
jgi:hypothetical protein